MTIVVGTDFSEDSSQASRIGALLARALSLPVHLVHVSADPRAMLVIRTSEEHLLEEDRRKLAGEAESLRRDFGVEVGTELEAGVISDQVCAAAERASADILIVGAGASARSMLGNTAERVARNVQVPVLAVRAGSSLEAWLTAGTPLRVLVASDMGATSQAAEAALDVLHRAGPLDVEVVHVAHPAATHARYGLPAPRDINVMDAAAEQLALRDLTEQGASFAWRDRRRVRVIAGSASADTHLAVLSEHADLVVVGVRKHSWLAAAWYGSVSSGVLRTAPTNVLSVPRSPIAPQRTKPARPRVVVVATDFSALGDDAVRAALSILDAGATLHLVHVLPGISSNEAEQRSGAYRQLQQRAPQGGQGYAVHLDVLVGHPANEVVSFARQVGADMICVGSHGRSGLGALVLGSTAHEILARSHVPVFIVPPVPE